MVNKKVSCAAGFVDELKCIFIISIPIVAIQFLQMFPGAMALIFCGHLNHVALGCAAISTSLTNVTGLSVIIGVSAACDTLYPQMFGSSNREKLGTLVQRGAILLLLCCMPCFALHVNAERFLVAMGQNPEVAQLAGQYMQIMIPGLAALAVYMSFSKYLQCQDIVYPGMVVGIISNALCALLHYIFLFKLDLGTNGSAYAVMLCYVSHLVLTLLYIVLSGVHRGTWEGFSMDAFQEWGQFLKLGYSGLFMTGFEWWSFEVGIFLAGSLGTVDLDAQSIAFQVESISYMLPLGVGIAASIRVGQCLGQGNAQAAKLSTKVSLMLIANVGFVVGIIIGAARFALPYMFTDNPYVVELAADVLPALAFYMLFNSINGVGCGILKGMGRQSLGSILLFCVYSIALATGIPTMLLSKAGVIGYWWCLAAVICVESLTLSTILIRTNWENEVTKALERTSAASNSEKQSLLSSNNFEASNDHDLDLENNVLEQRRLKQMKPWSENLCSRLATVGAYCGTFVLGLVVRIFLPATPPEPLQEYMHDLYNVTASWNETSLSPSDVL